MAGGRDPHEAFEALVTRYVRSIALFYRRRGFTGEECRDLSQQTFVRANQGLAHFRRSLGFKTWLFQIARNLWKNAVRERQTKESAAEVTRVLAAADEEHSLTRLQVAKHLSQLETTLNLSPTSSTGSQGYKL